MSTRTHFLAHKRASARARSMQCKCSCNDARNDAGLQDLRVSGRRDAHDERRAHAASPAGEAFIGAIAPGVVMIFCACFKTSTKWC
eukprot:6212360-Pleurochrysis_carterae.AAC.5